MSAQEHCIETIGQLVDAVTKQNLPVLVADLTLFLGYHISLRDNPHVVLGRTFEWTDDDTPGVSEVRVRRNDERHT